MSHRELEHASVSLAKFEPGRVKVSEDTSASPWELLTEAVEATVDTSTEPCVYLSPAGTSSIRLLPMDRRNPRRGSSQRDPTFIWKADQNFHSDLCLSSKQTKAEPNNVLITFEAMAREGVSLCLSPSMSFRMGNTYEVYFGHRGNLVTTLQRKSSGEESLHVSVPSRVCQERAWTSYWVALYQGKLYAGVGNEVGEQCIAILDDIARQDNPPPVEADSEETSTAVKYIGLGNTGTGDRQRQASPLKVRNACVTTVPAELQSKLTALKAEDLQVIQVGSEEDMDAETKALLEEYQQECEKAKARAAKFGVPYKEPAPDAFLPWSQARRLRANPKQGFVTGLDLSDPVEKSKQEARQKRFGIVTTGVVASDAAAGGDQESSQQQERSPLPVEQAWDNEALVRVQRTDPPPSLWTNPPPDTEQEQPVDEFSMSVEKPELVPTKVHIFSIDWSAFKQVRDNDVIAYFSIFSPTYIEWISDLSANVLFADQFSAKRAMEALSQELPSPPPESVSAAAPPHATVVEDREETSSAAPPDLGSMGWRLGKQPIRKVRNDRYGRRGTTARLLMRVATSNDILTQRPSSWPKPPPGFSPHRILGPGGDIPTHRDRSDKRGRERRDEGPRDVESMLEGGLRAGRSGFSVEELEAERSRKRAKTEPEGNAQKTKDE